MSTPNRTALLLAVTNNDLVRVQQLVPAIVSDGDTLTHAVRLAGTRGFLEIVEYLVDTGAEVDADLAYDAMQEGQSDVVLFLANRGVHVEEAFILAAEQGHRDVVQSLGQCVDGYTLATAVEQAVVHRHSDIVEYLVEEQDLDPDLLDRAFLYAVRNDDVDMVEYLLTQGVVPTESAMTLALRHNFSHMIQYLIQVGAALPVPLEDILVYAVGHNMTSLVEYLLSIGVDVNASEGEAIVQASTVPMLEYLLKKGGRPQQRVLVNAIIHRNLPVVKYLLGRYPFELTEEIVRSALVTQDVDLVRYLGEEQKVEFTSQELVHAIVHDFVEIVQYLVDSGQVDPSLHDHRAYRVALNRDPESVITRYLAQFAVPVEPHTYVQQQYSRQQQNPDALRQLVDEWYHDPLMIYWALEQGWHDLAVEMIVSLDFALTGEELVWAIRFNAPLDVVDALYMEGIDIEYNQCEALTEAILQNNCEMTRELVRDIVDRRCVAHAIEAAISRGVDNDAARVAMQLV